MRWVAILGLALAACGRLGYDAPTGDDDNFPDTVMASVTVLDEGTGVANIQVVVGNPDGTFRAIATTDANGVSVIEVPAGGMATIAYNIDGYRQVFTITDIQEDDAVMFGLPSVTDEWTSNAVVTMPGVLDGQNFFLLENGCKTYEIETPTDVVEMGVLQNCSEDGDYTMLASAFDQNAQLTAYSVVKDVLTNLQQPQVFSMPSWSSVFVQASVNFNQLPAAVDHAYVYAGPVFDNEDFQKAKYQVDFSIESTATPKLPPEAEGLVYRAEVYSEEIVIGQEDYFYPVSVWSGQIGQISVDIDVSSAPATVTSRFIDMADAARPVMRIVTAGDLAAYDAGITCFTWYDNAENYTSWTILYPPTVTDIKAPELPNNFSEYRPTSSSTYDKSFGGVIEFDFIADWKSVRTEWGPNMLLNDNYYPDLWLGIGSFTDKPAF